MARTLLTQSCRAEHRRADFPCDPLQQRRRLRRVRLHHRLPRVAVQPAERGHSALLSGLVLVKRVIQLIPRGR